MLALVFPPALHAIALSASADLRGNAAHLVLDAVPEFIGSVTTVLTITTISWALRRVRRALSRHDADPDT
ncbi:hypothetical protein [Streptomyces sp. NBC_00620]|uniref:hypothetical protein n=1 Tax=Streptomyces sp. NBC_00620 TaxID=2903666 RepID=UPI00225973D5|nr:hypothetical protein [Streptomyces sp. NBC_00620]MCX4976481.1 hypothetical protein [Streptomyces sp. NBC_00620]